MFISSDSCLDSSQIITDVKYKDVELIGCNLEFFNFKVSIFCFYCPPDISLEDFKYSLECSSTVMLNPNCLVFGDYNLPTIVWQKNQVNFSNDPKALSFEQFCLDSGLQQINYFPTRKSAVLDLILVNDELLISTFKCGTPIGFSDQNSLSVMIVPPSSNYKF